MKILYLGNQLSKHGFNKTTIETLSVLLEQSDFEVYCASDKKYLFFRMFEMIKAIILYRNKVSYILIDTYSTKAFWYAFSCSQVARFFKIKYIPILHGGNLPQRLKKNPKISRLIFANAYQNVSPSDYLKQVFEANGFFNVVFIPNSIEIQKYNYKERALFQPKLLWVRAFATIYNPKMAVAVLQQLQVYYPEATLTMVGPDKDGSLQITKDFANQKGVFVTFTGQLSKEAWWDLAAEHDVFINTTHYDNTPVSLLEAMALGLPVVSTNVGGISYLLTDKKNALLVPDQDVDQMTKAIVYLLSDYEYGCAQVRNARNFVSHFDWKEVKQLWKQLLT